MHACIRFDTRRSPLSDGDQRWANSTKRMADGGYRSSNGAEGNGKTPRRGSLLRAGSRRVPSGRSWGIEAAGGEVRERRIVSRRCRQRSRPCHPGSTTPSRPVPIADQADDNWHLPDEQRPSVGEEPNTPNPLPTRIHSRGRPRARPAGTSGNEETWYEQAMELSPFYSRESFQLYCYPHDTSDAFRRASQISLFSS